MTILTAIKAAVLRTTGVTVNNVYGNTAQIALEMADLVDDVATEIMRSHDWRSLTKVATVVNDGGEVYALPSDYDRMVAASSIDDAASWFWGYSPFASVSEWLQYKTGAYASVSPGGWIIIADELQFHPAPVGDAQYPYISNLYGLSEAGVEKGTFTADDDTFRLDERLLTLGLIWRWSSQKGLDYSEHLASYEMSLSRLQARDRGARVIRSPTHFFSGARTAYTGSAMG